MVDQAVIGEANTAMFWLNLYGNPDYKTVINDKLDTTAAITRAINKVEKALDDNNLDVARVRVFVGGRASLIQRAELDVVDGTNAIRYLKEQGRMIQIGPGGGTLLIMVDNTRFILDDDEDIGGDDLDDDPLDLLLANDDTPATIAGPEAKLVLQEADLTEDISITDVKNMITTAAEHLSSYIENEHKLHQEELNRREARIAELEDQIENLRLTTWR